MRSLASRCLTIAAALIGLFLLLGGSALAQGEDVVADLTSALETQIAVNTALTDSALTAIEPGQSRDLGAIQAAVANAAPQIADVTASVQRAHDASSGEAQQFAAA